MTSKLRLLIVDDDQRMAHTLVDILTMSGHHAVEASSGSLALEKINAQEFDCVLTDVRMPGMNGVEFHRQLHQSHPGLPVVLMTAYSGGKTLQEGLDNGVIGVLDKPLDINHLLAFFTSLAKNRIIAIVDDDPDFCKTLAGILQQRGFRVAQIVDPHTDIETIASGSQVILLDMNLNHLGGLQILKDIRACYPSLPVVMVTGYRQEMETAIKDALAINAYACLYKPLEIPALLEMLSQIQLVRLREMIKD
jgi:DNA-binding NtrC family response regulator